MLNMERAEKSSNLIVENITSLDSKRKNKTRVNSNIFSIRPDMQDNISIPVAAGISLVIQNDLYNGISLERNDGMNNIKISTINGEVIIRNI